MNTSEFEQSELAVKIAYIVNQYPKVSHTFIRREILALEGLGCSVLRIAFRGWDLKLVDPDDLAERDKTRYTLRSGVPFILFCLVSAMTKHPFSFFHALALACRMSKRAERPLYVHFGYLVQACVILVWVSKEGVAHMHAHFGTNSAEVAMFVRELGGPPWSLTIHGPEEYDKKFIIGLAEKLRRCAFAVAISSFGRAQLYRLIDHAHWSKVQVVRCGIDSSFRVPGPLAQAAKPTFLCVGRLCEQKGQLLLLEATKRLLGSGAEFGVVFAGDGELRGEIEEFVKINQLERSVRVTGWISSADVRKELLNSRALVLPSFAEGLPVAIMEAMAVGRPVISTFVAGIPELVHDRKHGWLIPAGSIDALVDAMAECLKADPDRLEEMGRLGQQQVFALHDVNEQAKGLLQLFRSMSR